MDYPYLRGKVALVTGASRGIGAATALLLGSQRSKPGDQLPQQGRPC